ncbi:MAG: hypothetical protein ABWZ25_16990 [Chitinophagaceae bacterium]
MKSAFRALLLATILFTSCSKNVKDEELKTPEDGIVLKLIGQVMRLESYTAEYTINQGWHRLNINGRDTTNGRLLAVTIMSQSEIVPGEYVYTTSVPNATAAVAFGANREDIANADIYNSQNMTPPNPMKITITSIGNNRLTGGFSGDVRKQDNIMKNISGNFNLSYSR